MKKSILLGNNENVTRVYPDYVLKNLENNAGLDTSHVYTKAELLSDPSVAKEAQYVFSTWGMPHFDTDEIRRVFPSLRAIFYAAGTVQGFAREFLDAGIAVFSAWAANAVPVAEYTESQILLANKGFFRVAGVCSDSQKGYFDARSTFASYNGNYGNNVGIIGAGMIGKMVISRLKTHNINVFVYDPFLPDEKALELGARKCTLEELFSLCDTISNHVANNPQTVGMINYSLLSKMKQGATFINTGRGAQVVETDLIRIMTERNDLVAVLDVTFPEPPEEGSPLYSLPNIILTPHIAGSSGNEVWRMAEYMQTEFECFDKGKDTKYSVTAKMLETMA